MFDFSMHNILESNLINFVILFTAIVLLVKNKIKDAVFKAQTDTVMEIEMSDKRKKSAIKKFKKVKDDYENLPQETEEIETTAKNTLNSLEEKAKNDLKNAKQILQDSAARSIVSETARINSVLSKEMAENSIIKAVEEIKQKLIQDKSMHDKLIEQAIDELEIK